MLYWNFPIVENFSWNEEIFRKNDLVGASDFAATLGSIR